jgi:hypothetical protein
MEIFNWLNNNEFIEDYKILEYWTKPDKFYLKLKIKFFDHSELHTREHLSSELRAYSFHWQTSDELLITRWDNAPHHPEISSYPHHIHDGSENNVKEGFDISFGDVLKYIFDKLRK